MLGDNSLPLLIAIKKGQRLGIAPFYLALKNADNFKPALLVQWLGKRCLCGKKTRSS